MAGEAMARLIICRRLANPAENPAYVLGSDIGASPIESVFMATLRYLGNGIA